MTTFFLGIYDFMTKHGKVRWLLLFVSTLLLLGLMLRLSYKEDISDFLPLGQRHAEALRIYQQISSADRIFVIFQGKDETWCEPDSIVESIDDYLEVLRIEDFNNELEGNVSSVDLGEIEDLQEFLYMNIPYFLTDADYVRMDSLLLSDNYIVSMLQEDKRKLMLPSGSLLTKNIEYDPICLFTPVIERILGESNIQYEMYDGQIFSPDMRRAILMINSPYGSSETDRNAKLISLLQKTADSTLVSHPNVDIHLTGGPVIAVGNARQIKTDSMLSVTLAMIVILSLLFYVFRDARNLLLITLSIAWGWLFAMGGMAIAHHEVSLIVIGISAVILGIAVNYPLHMIAHLSHNEDKRSSFKDIITPLIVGNVTTIGAFLALVPLQSLALRDLGIFASLLLLGTICFVLLFLPHMAYAKHKSIHTVLDSVVNVKIETKPWMVVCIVILSLIFGYFSLNTKFDSDLSNINYMTDQQKQDLTYFQQMLGGIENEAQVYAISTGSTAEQALLNSEKLQPTIDGMRTAGLISGQRGCVGILASNEEQLKKIGKWNSFTKKYAESITKELEIKGAREGFSLQSFYPFTQMLQESYTPRELYYFSPLTKVLYNGYLEYDSITRDHIVVDVLYSTIDKRDEVKDNLENDGVFCFDMAGINSAIANHLSDNFNYIGWMCSLIVFFFLWLSMGSIELAIISFIPMAISWVWILGAMALMNIQFNIVNIILATFIFGQGDDYTIFITEGVCYEYAYRRKILNSYKNSIIVSALIMFIGIGSLIIARHPALHSLAEVTIIGMFSVVLMAYVLPPILFNFMISTNKGLRPRPLHLRPMLSMLYCTIVFLVQLSTFYVYRWILVFVDATNRRKLLHKYAHRLFRFDFNNIPGVKFDTRGFDPSLLRIPSMVICNHQSMLDSIIFLALSPKCIIISNKKPPANFIVSRAYKWLGFICLSDDLESDINIMGSRVAEGYSIVMFPEGERNPDSSILRFHKGAFYIAEKLGLNVLPVLLHGANDVLPRNSAYLFNGSITVKVLSSISQDDQLWGLDYATRTKNINDFYKIEYTKFASSLQTATYYKEYILDHYRYKGVDVFNEVKRRLKTRLEMADSLPCDDTITIADEGYGEIALAAALVAPQRHVNVMLRDADREAIFLSSSEGVGNISVIEEISSDVSPIRL